MRLKAMLRLKMGWASGEGPRRDVVLSSRLRLARNVAEHPFVNRAAPRQLAAVASRALAAAGKSKSLGKAALIRLEEIDPLDRLFLLERRLISSLLAQNPAQRAVAVGEREVLSLMVNEEDHLRLQGVESGFCLGELLEKVCALDDELAAELPFAYREDLGYLTACPTNVGTGLRASCLVHLPALGFSGRLGSVLEELKRRRIQARGLYGEGTKVMGDFYQISNASTLGPSEAELVRSVSAAVEALLKSELEARAALQAGRKDVLHDWIFRALALLGSARRISYEESLQHFSAARLALSLGWKMPVDWHTLNALLVLAQPAHVQMTAGKELSAEERDVLRAALLRKKFGG